MAKHCLNRIIAACLLLAYLVTGTQFVPGAIALLAAVDGSHDLAISSDHATITVTLHHRSGDYTPSINDHRNKLARILTSFCAEDRRGDHCVSSREISQALQTGDHLRISKPCEIPLETNELATARLRIFLPVWNQTLQKIPANAIERCPSPMLERLTTVQLII